MQEKSRSFGAREMPPLAKNNDINAAFPGCDFMEFYQCSREKKRLHMPLHLSHYTSSPPSGEGSQKSFEPIVVQTSKGSNFKLGERVIDSIFEQDGKNTRDSVMSYNTKGHMDLQYIRCSVDGKSLLLIGTVERASTKSVGRKKLSHSELYTIITQIETIVNTRPLTSLCTSSVDNIPIRVVDFLQSSLKYSLMPTDDLEEGDPAFDPSLIQAVV
ncbi:hypothetical protein RB195_024674 [Necator americanus]|uniref:Uncharacterized protein n=1 Tax=Necator americanus TaxID=51031 RepID=A0ABR1ERC3_NECAM